MTSTLMLKQGTIWLDVFKCKFGKHLSLSLIHYILRAYKSVRAESFYAKQYAKQSDHPKFLASNLKKWKSATDKTTF